MARSHSIDLDTMDLVDDYGEFNCVREHDIDDWDEVSNLPQERGNGIKNLDSAIVDNLNSHGIGNDVEIDCKQRRGVDKSCNTIDMVNVCGELSSNEAEQRNT
ncbi:hypothetical protein ACH5RR_025686 [Cinchona calisaya]|uniref:Uncharacterized protein n=1 Tax=Cinchona calisaya TaxID=153742 RepID=A0ABD2Z0C1_9GENT